MWSSSSSSSSSLPQWLYPSRWLQGGSSATRSEIVELVPFDVTIGLNSTDEDDEGGSSIDVFALTDIVEDWLGDSFDANNLGEDYARFTTIILDYQDESTRRARFLQQTTSTFVASYEGVTVWTKQGTALVPDDTIVAAIQTQALIQDEGLLEALQDADPSTGLGPAVTNVRASISSGYNKDGDNDNSNNASNDGLNVIIIVAIAIAGVAFLLLAFALFMAWRHSRATLNKGHNLETPEGTGDESDLGEQSGNTSSQQQQQAHKRASAAAMAATSPPTEVDASASGLYPESVISEDISTSLTAYYQSGMAGSKRMMGSGGGVAHNASHMLNDAASVSSMESYGYSLDGYTNSIAPTDYDHGKDDPY